MINVDRLRRRARWKSKAGQRLWTYSGYGRRNDSEMPLGKSEHVGELALWMGHEAAAMERAADFIETGIVPRERRTYRNYDL